MENAMENLIYDITAKVQREKERLIKLTISEKVGEEIDLINEVKKRFPRILSIRNIGDQSEHWYWNDGSDTGLLLISFYERPLEYNSDPTKFGMGVFYTLH